MVFQVKEKDVRTVSMEGHGHMNMPTLSSLPPVGFLTIHSPSRSPRASEDPVKEAELCQMVTRTF